MQSKTSDDTSSNGSTERDSLLRSEHDEYSITPMPASEIGSVNAAPDVMRKTQSASGEFYKSDLMNSTDLSRPGPGNLSDSGVPPPHLRHTIPIKDGMKPDNLVNHRFSQPLESPVAHIMGNHQPGQPQHMTESKRTMGDSVEIDGTKTTTTKRPLAEVKSVKGKELLNNLQKAYDWKNRFDNPSQEFLSLMDRLYMECQLHLTALSSRGDLDSRREADVIVNEMIVLRNHWGPALLPGSICNAFVRERIPLTLGIDQRQFRIDCAQFFEPVPFYGNQQGNPGELMKMFRFSVYDVAKNEVVLRYYLERSNVIQLYHVLCFTCENYRGQVHPYGSELPSYWEIRQHMLEDVYSRLLSALSQGSHPPPRAHAATIFPPTRGAGPVIIQVPSRAVPTQT